MWKAARIGVLLALLGVVGVLAYQSWCADDGKSYVYQVMIDPARGGPTLVTFEMPERVDADLWRVDADLWRVEQVDGSIVYFKIDTFFVIRSVERVDRADFLKTRATLESQTQET